MAKEMLKKIQNVEVEANELISKSIETTNQLARENEIKIKKDGEKILSETRKQLQDEYDEAVKKANEIANDLLAKEREFIAYNILNIDENKIDEIASILKERIVE